MFSYLCLNLTEFLVISAGMKAFKAVQQAPVLFDLSGLMEAFTGHGMGDRQRTPTPFPISGVPMQLCKELACLA